MKKLEFISEDITPDMYKLYDGNVVECIDKMIKYCRHLEKEKKEGRMINGGIDTLKELMHTSGIMPSLYIKIKEAIGSPELKYEISVV